MVKMSQSEQRRASGFTVCLFGMAKGHFICHFVIMFSLSCYVTLFFLPDKFPGSVRNSKAPVSLSTRHGDREVGSSSGGLP